MWRIGEAYRRAHRPLFALVDGALPRGCLKTRARERERADVVLLAALDAAPQDGCWLTSWPGVSDARERGSANVELVSRICRESSPVHVAALLVGTCIGETVVGHLRHDRVECRV
jgi:hypothetical protein